MIFMSMMDEIEQVAQDEEKRNNRKSRSVRTVRTRNLKPTYFAVLLGKMVFIYRGLRKAPVRPVPKPVIQSVDPMDIVKEDFVSLKAKIYGTLVPAKPRKKMSGDTESWKDWEGEL
jgi:LysM repeat protein